MYIIFYFKLKSYFYMIKSLLNQLVKWFLLSLMASFWALG